MAQRSGAYEERISRKARKQLKREARRMNAWTFLVCILALTVGFGAGIGAYGFICRDDCFYVIGKKEIAVPLGEDFLYNDKGAMVVEFGQDISEKVKVETNLTDLGDGIYTVDTSVSGRYYIRYTVDTPKYGNVCRIRTFVVGGDN